MRKSFYEVPSRDCLAIFIYLVHREAIGVLLTSIFECCKVHDELSFLKVELYSLLLVGCIYVQHDGIRVTQLAKVFDPFVTKNTLGKFIEFLPPDYA